MFGFQNDYVLILHMGFNIVQNLPRVLGRGIEAM